MQKTGTINPQKAGRDIICYKLFGENPKSKVFHCKNTPIEIGTELSSEISFRELSKTLTVLNTDFNKVEESWITKTGILSYSALSKCFSVLEWAYNRNNQGLYLCIIPKGSLYVKLDDGNFLSNKLIVRDLIMTLNTKQLELIQNYENENENVVDPDWGF